MYYKLWYMYRTQEILRLKYALKIIIFSGIRNLKY